MALNEITAIMPIKTTGISSKINKISLCRYSLSKKYIKLCLFEWWCHLILNYLNSCSVTYNLTILL